MGNAIFGVVQVNFKEVSWNKSGNGHDIRKHNYNLHMKQRT